MYTVAKFATPCDLSVSALETALEMYKESFGESAALLIVGDSLYWRAKEILHGGNRIWLEIAPWLPDNVWMVTGRKRVGLIYSGD